jgi:phage terminase small subunit
VKRTNAGVSKASAVQRRSLFVAKYLSNGENATQAAIAAGYSPKTAKQAGHRLLTNSDVRAAIEKHRKAATEKAELTVERTLREVARIAYFDPRKLYDADGRLKKLHELDDDTAAAVSGVEMDAGAVVKIKHWDKNSALDKAMKYLGLYEKDNQQPAEAMAKAMAATPLEIARRVAFLIAQGMQSQGNGNA